MKKVCVFGDSLSKGVVLDASRGRYLFARNNFVQLVCNHLKYEVANFAKFGCTVNKGTAIVERHLEEISQSSFTLLEFGGNDSDFAWDEIAADPNRVHQPRTPLDVFERSYTCLVTTIKRVGVQPVLLNLPPIDAQRYFDWFSQNLNQENILKWLGGSTDYIYRWHEMYSMRICQIANRCSAPLIDIRSAFLERHDYTDYLCDDGIHPNEKGHELISAYVEKLLTPTFATV